MSETAKQEVVKILQEFRDLEARAEKCLLELGWQHKYIHGLQKWCKENHGFHSTCWMALNTERSITLGRHVYTVGYDGLDRATIYRDNERWLDLKSCDCGSGECRGWIDSAREWMYIDPRIIEGLGLVRRRP